MLTIKCPSCASSLKLKQAPASGKVKCPKCGNVVPARSPAAARPVAVAGGLDPDDEGFDFANIQAPSASGVTSVSHFPVSGNMSVYQGPIPGDPLEMEKEPEDKSATSADGSGSGSKKKSGRDPKVLIGVLAAVGVLMIVGIGAAAMMFSGGGSSGPGNAELLAAAQKTAPSGYQAFSKQGVIVLMPAGDPITKFPGVIEAVAVISNETGSTYYMGAMNGGRREIDSEQMRKKAERQLGGDILGGTPTERNGYKGIKGMLDGSIFFPRMPVEVYHVDERFVILGCAPYSMTADPGEKVDRLAEEAEQKIFYGSFNVGPKPSGWFW